MIYLLEDDESIRKLVTYALEREGFRARGFDRPSAFWPALEEELPELVLLDIMLPEEDGLSVLARLRAAPATRLLPVMMMTAKSNEYDRVVGLDCGADDYISKPFGMMELAARVRALLRRTRPETEETQYRLGGLYVCPDRHIVRVDGQDVALTYREFRLLCLLLENTERVLSRDAIMERAWDNKFIRENRTVDVHIRTLRAKLGTEGGRIETVRGMGYKMGGTP